MILKHDHGKFTMIIGKNVITSCTNKVPEYCPVCTPIGPSHRFDPFCLELYTAVFKKFPKSVWIRIWPSPPMSGVLSYLALLHQSLPWANGRPCVISAWTRVRMYLYISIYTIHCGRNLN